MAATGYAQSVVYSSNGTLIGRFGTTDRQMLPYNEIPQNIINAVLAAEDRHFWNEGGISPTATVRAAFADLTGNDSSLQGGSTITQQFVRNYYQGIGTQQTVSRKIKEIFVAMKVAKEKSKQWILQNYLNTIYLGNGAYGVQAAAETYFNKPVGQLSVAQDAVIAALIQQPSTYPLAQYRPELEARWHYVIDGMVQLGAISGQKAAALKFPIPGDHVPQSVGTDVWDPYVLNMVRTELKQVYHFSDAQIDDGGYVIKTSVDDTKMAALYAAINQNEQQIDNSAYPFQSYMHAGAVLEDPATGAIQAVYAGPGFPGSKYNGTGRTITVKQCEAIQCQYDMATVNREQVGSSFKPYILATAVKESMNVQSSTLDGYTPLSIPPDYQPNTYPQTAAPPGASGWSLQVNNDSPGENGPYTPQIAMAASINTAYADLWHVVAGIRRGHERARHGAVARRRHQGPRLRHVQVQGRGDAGARPGVADRRRAGLDAGHHRRQRRLSRRAPDHQTHPEHRADPDQGHQRPGVQQQPDAERGDGLAGPVRDVRGHRVLRHGSGGRDEQRPGDHRQDRDHGDRPVGLLHRRHPDPGARRRAVHARPERREGRRSRSTSSAASPRAASAGPGRPPSGTPTRRTCSCRSASRSSSRWCSPGSR